MDVRFLLVCMASGYLYVTTEAQPTECFNNECDTGYFCVEETYICKKCIDCGELKRETLPGAGVLGNVYPCIQAVANCGSCLKGFVPDLDTGIGCVSPDSNSQKGLPENVWAAVAVLVVLLALIIIAITMYLLRNSYSSLKVLASTRTSLRSPCNSDNYSASAPESPPPPYNVDYVPLNATSTHEDTINDEEYVKRAGSSPTGAEIRESSSTQAANAFSTPCYVRRANLNDLNGYTTYDVENEAVREPIAPEEDTLESPWVPNGRDEAPDRNSTDTMNGELSHLLTSARGSTLVRTGNPALERISTQDSNNNRSTGESMGGAGNPNTGTSLTINVITCAVQNINSAA